MKGKRKTRNNIIVTGGNAGIRKALYTGQLEVIQNNLEITFSNQSLIQNGSGQFKKKSKYFTLCMIQSIYTMI
ncbi:hypothetical protein LPYR103PRE_23220 [Segatella asaccharophila]